MTGFAACECVCLHARVTLKYNKTLSNNNNNHHHNKCCALFVLNYEDSFCCCDFISFFRFVSLCQRSSCHVLLKSVCMTLSQESSSLFTLIAFSEQLMTLWYLHFALVEFCKHFFGCQLTLCDLWHSWIFVLLFAKWARWETATNHAPEFCTYIRQIGQNIDISLQHSSKKCHKMSHWHGKIPTFSGM